MARRSPSSRAALRELQQKYETEATNRENMASMAEKEKLSTSYLVRNLAQRKRTYAKRAKRMAEE